MPSKNTNNPNVVLSGDGRGAANRRGADAVLHFPAAPDKLSMGMLFKFIKFEYDFNTGGKQKIVTGTDMTDAHIALPLPENLVDSLGINYETTDLGLAVLGMQKGNQTGEALKNFLSSSEASAEGKDTGNVASGLDVGEYVVRSLAQVSGAVGGALNLASGNVPNPFQTAIFKNVEIRQHNFTFRLVPETPEDSVMITKIISQFKYRALPGKTGGSAFLTMPEEVDVLFFGTNALYGFARCVIKRIQVNYSPQNVPSFFKNTPENNLVGAPQAVELQIELSEIEQLSRESFEQEGASGDLPGFDSPQAKESVPRDQQSGNGLRAPNASNPIKRNGG